MNYQIYNITTGSVIVTAESFEEAQDFLSLYEEDEKVYLAIRTVFKDIESGDEVTKEMAQEADVYNPEEEWL